MPHSSFFIASNGMFRPILEKETQNRQPLIPHNQHPVKPKLVRKDKDENEHKICSRQSTIKIAEPGTNCKIMFLKVVFLATLLYLL